MTAMLENKSGKIINLFYGAATTGDSAELLPRFEDFIEHNRLQKTKPPRNNRGG